MYNSANYWTLINTKVHHNGLERSIEFDLESLGVGQSVGCMVNKEGELRYFLDNVDQGVVWNSVPTDKPLWGFANIFGKVTKIQSEFFLGRYMHYILLKSFQ